MNLKKNAFNNFVLKELEEVALSVVRATQIWQRTSNKPWLQ